MAGRPGDEIVPPARPPHAGSAVKAYASSGVVRRTFFLYASQMSFVLLAMATSTLNARFLGRVAYGTLTFFASVTGFCSPLFRLGLFSSGHILLAREKDNTRERELVGVILVVALFLGIAFSGFMLVVSLFVDQVFRTDIGHLLRIFCPLLAVLPAETLLSSLSTGTGKTGPLAWFNVLPKTLYLIAALFVIFFSRLTIAIAILLGLSAIAVCVVTLSFTFRPKFSNLGDRFRSLWQMEKQYGIHVFWGGAVGQTTYSLDLLLVPYFAGTTNLGFYALGLAMMSPIPTLSRSLCQTLYKSFADEEKIPARVTRFNSAWLVLSSAGLVILGPFVVPALFGPSFSPIVPLLPPLAAAGFFQGMYQPLNFFLGVKAKGKWLRNLAVPTSVVNLVGNVVFIPIWGAMGAAVVTCLSRLVSYIGYEFYYRRYKRKQRDAQQTL